MGMENFRTKPQSRRDNNEEFKAVSGCALDLGALPGLSRFGPSGLEASASIQNVLLCGGDNFPAATFGLRAAAAMKRAQASVAASARRVSAIKRDKIRCAGAN
jgi:hypothetical protein